MNLQNRIKLLHEQLALKKPQIITNYLNQDILVEKDIQGKNLYDIKDKNTIKLLSGDLSTFNDYAFRYYLFQFIYFCDISIDYIIEDMFIQEFFKSVSLNETTKRFLQFEYDEIKIIIEFLQKALDDINKVIGNVDLYNKLVPWEQEELIAPFKLFKPEIEDALHFWKKHPKYKIKKCRELG